MNVELATALELTGERVLLDRHKIDLETLHRYAWASGDDNPIHYNSTKAREMGLPGVIGHGMLTLALMNGCIETLAREVGATRGREMRVSGIDTRFVGMLMAGDDLSISAKGFRGSTDSLSVHVWAYRNGARDQLVCTATVVIENLPV